MSEHQVKAQKKLCFFYAKILGKEEGFRSGMGFFRVGCLGCPLAGKIRWSEFRMFPSYEQAYLRAFERMLNAIHLEGRQTKWKTAAEGFSWWMEEETMEG